MLKVGSFYHVYDKDAILMFYLFSYKILENRVGFPISALSKVIRFLRKNEINYYVYDEKLEEFEINHYDLFVEKSKEYYHLRSEIDEIYHYLITNIERKYMKRLIQKIKEVIDEG
ncbi:MAG: hypothetical protein ACI4P7_00890 [Bacilli bacterium]